MEVTKGFRKWAILRVGFPPNGDTMCFSLSSKMVPSSGGSAIHGNLSFNKWLWTEREILFVYGSGFCETKLKCIGLATMT